jgi:hypothetical protein
VFPFSHALAILSSNSDWSKIENVLPELDAIFCNFRLQDYSCLEFGDINQRLVPWFKSRHAGSQSLGICLTNLIYAARKLLSIAENHESLDHYFEMLVAQRNGDLPSVAFDLGISSSQHKLPGFGIPLAAEFLKNIGYDIAKPDRHVNRAAGSFGWVVFRTWQNREGTNPPKASRNELVTVMREVSKFSSAIQLPVCYVDNAVWLICAKSGLYLDNNALSNIAHPNSGRADVKK